MDKLGAIGGDISAGAHATYLFWKHVSQFLLELVTFGYLQFELEREKISESSLKDLHGRYLKFKVKSPAAGKSDISLTPYGQEKLLDQDPMEGYEGFAENSPEFLKQIEQLNEVWYVFAGLALFFAIGAFLIHRNLQKNESMKVDFSASANRQANNARDQLHRFEQQ